MLCTITTNHDDTFFPALKTVLEVGFLKFIYLLLLFLKKL